MKLTREECMETFYRFKVGMGTGKDMVLFKQLINEHFELIKAIEFIFGVKSEDVLKEYEEMEF